MGLSTRDDLKNAIAAWLNRDDLTERLDDFIRLAESTMVRRLRRKTVRAAITLTGAEVPLPAGCAELRSIRLNAGPRLGAPLRIGTYEMVAERANSGPATGTPRLACVVNATLLLAPAPDQPYAAEIVYFETLTPLSAANAANSTLLEAPDAYLYGALMEAEPYLENDERAPLWERKFEKALAELESAREREEFNASLRPVRLPVVFG